MGTIPLLYGPSRGLAESKPLQSLQPLNPTLARTWCFPWAWVKLGTHGNLGYSSDGVRLEVAESLTDIFTDGTNDGRGYPAYRGINLLTATLMEDSLDMDMFNMFQMAFNNNVVT